MKTKIKTNTDKKKDYADELASTMPSESVERVKREAEKEIFRIRLSELRKKMGIRQEDIKAFTQSGISKLESRKDMKVSTLVDYLNSIGMGVEIKVYPKNIIKKSTDTVTLLKIG